MKLDVAILVALTFSCGSAYCAEPVLIPAGKAVAGATQVEWSERWWQWAKSFEMEESPVADVTGRLCSAKQDGPVWFLAGTYESKRTIRFCRVPEGKFLFFPLINYVVYPARNRQCECECLMATAKEITDDPTALILEVDGVRFDRLASHRLVTKTCFALGPTTGAGNGYYAMLRPLARGRHTLNFGGALPDLQQALTYTVEVY